MTAIVRYRPKRVARRFAPYTLAKYAYRGNRLAKYAGRARAAGLYGRMAVGAARFAYRAYQAYSGRKRSVARSAPSSRKRAKFISEYRNSTNASVYALRQKFLYSSNFIQLARGIDQNQRQSARIFVKGFKVCLQVTNRGTVDHSFHWAIIQEKSPADNTVLSSNFFRDTTNTTGRYVDFVQNTTSDTWDFNQICCPINADRFQIITHRKTIIGQRKPASAPSADQHGLGESKWNRMYDLYIPIKRNIVFENAGALTQNKKWWFVMWCMPIDAADYQTGESVAGTLYTSMKFTTYYSDGST